MVSSLNQVRHLFVANAVATKDTLAKAGDIAVNTVGDIQKDVYFMLQGPDTVLKSDYIPVKGITYAKAIAAADLATPMKKVVVTLDANVNSGNPIVGQDYILRINLRQFYGMGDQDQYFKDAAVRATKDMTAEDFYYAMVDALNASFSREVGATKDSNPYLYFEASANGILIEENPQEWILGVEAQERVYFDVVPTTVFCEGVDVIWGAVEYPTPTTMVPNGKNIADLEYFLLGERGDQYRKIGWPNDIETQGLVDPTKEYNVFEIHYTFSDTGVNNYNTEKDITIVSPTASVINSIITAFNSATGLNVKALS